MTVIAPSSFTRLGILGWAAMQPDARQGALLSIREVRAFLANPPDFDAAILYLADHGCIALHHADHPDDAPDGVPDPGRRDHAGRPARIIGFSLR